MPALRPGLQHAFHQVNVALGWQVVEEAALQQFTTSRTPRPRTRLRLLCTVLSYVQDTDAVRLQAA